MTAPGGAERDESDAPAATDTDCYGLTLFVSGASSLSARAIANARLLCDTHLGGHYHLSVVDVHENPAAVVGSGVVAMPTLLKQRPAPARKFVGDLSRTEQVLATLNLPFGGTTPTLVG